jgi:hypothetical protein
MHKISKTLKIDIFLSMYFKLFYFVKYYFKLNIVTILQEQGENNV